MIADAQAHPLPRLAGIGFGLLMVVAGSVLVRFDDPLARMFNAPYAFLRLRFRYSPGYVRVNGWIGIGLGIVVVVLSAALGH